MSTDPNALAELLRRAQLAKSLSVANNGVQQAQDATPPQLPAQTQINPLAGQINPQVNAPTPLTRREAALDDYRKALQTPAPSLQDYHPSIGRRIAGALLGGIAGMHDPKSGYTVGHGIAYGPYDQKLTEYQRELASKKEAFDTETGAEEEQSKLTESGLKGKAEVARAAAEEARKLEEEGKGEALKPGTPQAEEAERLKRIEHPISGRVGSELYDITLKNGEALKGVSRDDNGQFKDSNGNIIGPDAVDKIDKVGTEKNSKELKPPREGEAGLIDKFTEEHGRPPTYNEQMKIHKDYSEVAHKPEGSDALEIRKSFQMQGARTAANRTYQRNFDLASQQIDKISEATTMIDRGSPTDIAIAVPKILTALVSGQGTGLRINEKEMNRLIKARGLGESIEALASRISGHGDLGQDQRRNLKSLMSDVEDLVSKKQKVFSDTMDKIDSAENLSDINKAHQEHRKRLMEDEKPKQDNKKDPLNLLGDN
jgi:hypothetical protein